MTSTINYNINNTEDIISDLNEAINFFSKINIIFSILTIPSDFEKKEYLRQFKTNTKRMQEHLIKYKKTLETAGKKYLQIENSQKNSISKALANSYTVEQLKKIYSGTSDYINKLVDNAGAFITSGSNKNKTEEYIKEYNLNKYLKINGTSVIFDLNLYLKDATAPVKEAAKNSLKNKIKEYGLDKYVKVSGSKITINMTQVAKDINKIETNITKLKNYVQNQIQTALKDLNGIKTGSINAKSLLYGAIEGKGGLYDTYGNLIQGAVYGKGGLSDTYDKYINSAFTGKGGLIDTYGPVYNTIKNFLK